MPLGASLETSLHAKRRRRRQPSARDCAPAQLQRGSDPSLLPPQPEPEAESQPAPEVHPSSSGLALSPAHSVPSAMAFNEVGSAHSTPTVGRRVRRTHHRRQRLDKEDIEFTLNYGSEPSSDEEELMPPLVLRKFRSVMETPIDVEHPAEPDDQPNAVSNEPLVDSSLGVDPMATDQPRSLFDFKWEPFSSVPIRPELRRERFSQSNVGPATPCVDPYDIFIAIWDRQIMEHIVSETNKYAQLVAAQLINSNNLKPGSRIREWRDVTVGELYLYFAILIAMGVVVKSKVEEYWAITADIFQTPGFRAHMSYNRFHLISKCLHFNDNENMCALNLDASEAKLYKIKPLLTHLNMKFESMYTPAQNVALDESLLMWKGWLDINQLIPNKAATVGIKTYEVCESQTGYLWRFEVHTHKRSPPQQLEDPLNAFTPTLVSRLLHGLEYKGYTVWMDNYYNSPVLARRLKSLGFDCVGTLRTNRKFVPRALNELTKQNMHEGQVSGFTSGDVDAMVWRDSNRVAMISTYHGNAVSSDKNSTKPILILDYNIMMGGVDKKDQMLAMYPMERKRTRIWYKKLFRRLLNVTVLNSFIIYKQSCIQNSNHNHRSLYHRNFRISLVNALLSRHSIDRRASLPLLPSQPTQGVTKINVDHRLQYHPQGATNHQKLRRTCVVCKKKTTTSCVGCNKPVCLQPCFLTLHI